MTTPSDFIRTKITEDLQANKNDGRVVTRFPPEPNGYLHIGHAKSICLNFGVAQEFAGGVCHMRFDDTNPTKEEVEYAESIMRDVRWLGFDWGDKLFYASDYFAQFHDYAVQLIRMGKAYVCSLTAEEIKAHRGTLTEPGVDSPYRTRSIEENLDLFARMRAGEFADGTHILRAKIDMASPNLNMRDPAIYRIRKTSHHRTGDAWCIYPMYDYAHCLSDSIERITHSLCTLEFEDHRPLYDWFLDTLATPYHAQQIEFARLNLTFTVMSKRKLLQMVNEKQVSGWDDPRMLTISGLRRRGYTPASIRNFCELIGISKKESRIDMGVLENCIREDLNENAPRVMAVLMPLKVIIDNYPDDLVEEMVADNHPKRPELGTRMVPFCKEIYIEQEDFMETVAPKFFRLAPGREVRLRSAYLITCQTMEMDPATSKITAIHCTYDPASRGGSSPDGRKVKGTLHWVSARHGVKAEVRLYDRLFLTEDPEADKSVDFKKNLNPNSLTILSDCILEPGLAQRAMAAVVSDKLNVSDCNDELHYQFERQGYFYADPVAVRTDGLVFNRIVGLRDTWAKVK